MRFIVGLGNPGLTYRMTRHNLGFMVVDRLARKHGISVSRRRFGARCGEGEIRGEPVVLVKPYLYMNRSGPPTRDLLASYGGTPGDLIVIHDDLDLDFGVIRIKRKGGHGGHKGIESLIEALGRSDFARLKIGIGRPDGRVDITDFVLRPFERGERARLGSVLCTAVGAVEMILVEGIEKATSALHASSPCEKEDR